MRNAECLGIIFPRYKPVLLTNNENNCVAFAHFTKANFTAWVFDCGESFHSSQIEDLYTLKTPVNFIPSHYQIVNGRAYEYPELVHATLASHTANSEHSGLVQLQHQPGGPAESRTLGTAYAELSHKITEIGRASCRERV